MNTHQKIRPILITTAIAAGIMIACETKPDVIPKSDFLNYPSITVRSSRSVLNDSGKVKLILSFPVMHQYDNTESPYNEFPEGMRVEFFDGDTIAQGTVTAKYAKYTGKDDLWELKDSVVVINEKNEKLETEVLNWNQKKDLIYTDRFVKMTTEDMVMQGFGFESDSHLNRRRIKKVSATIDIPDEE